MGVVVDLDKRLVGIVSLSDLATRHGLGQDFLDTLTEFWTHYEHLRGVGFKVLGTRSAKAAVKSVEAHAKPASIRNLSGACERINTRRVPAAAGRQEPPERLGDP